MLDRAVPFHTLLDISANKSKAELAHKGTMSLRSRPSSEALRSAVMRRSVSAASNFSSATNSFQTVSYNKNWGSFQHSLWHVLRLTVSCIFTIQLSIKKYCWKGILVLETEYYGPNKKMLWLNNWYSESFKMKLPTINLIDHSSTVVILLFYSFSRTTVLTIPVRRRRTVTVVTLSRQQQPQLQPISTISEMIKLLVPKDRRNNTMLIRDRHSSHRTSLEDVLSNSPVSQRSLYGPLPPNFSRSSPRHRLIRLVSLRPWRWPISSRRDWRKGDGAVRATKQSLPVSWRHQLPVQLWHQRRLTLQPRLPRRRLSPRASRSTFRGPFKWPTKVVRLSFLMLHARKIISSKVRKSTERHGSKHKQPKEYERVLIGPYVCH